MSLFAKKIKSEKVKNQYGTSTRTTTSRKTLKNPTVSVVKTSDTTKTSAGGEPIMSNRTRKLEVAAGATMDGRMAQRITKTNRGYVNNMKKTGY